MSYQLIQSLSLYIPFVRDDVTLELFREAFHEQNIGKVSVVDFIVKADSPLREAFVHFELFYNTKQAYDFQLTLESEQRIRIFYNERTFWSISKNFSKKASATLGGRKIRLNLTDEPASDRPDSPEEEEEDHYMSEIDLEEEWKEEYNTVYGDEDSDEQECSLSAFSEEEDFVQVHATPEEMTLVSSDYAVALENQNDMLRGQLEFMAIDYAYQNEEIQRQEQEIEDLYRLLAEKEQEKIDIVRYWQQTELQIQEKVEEKKDCLIEAITRNGYSEFKKINEFTQAREEKLVGIMEEMKQEWSSRMGTYAEEFEAQMNHMKMMMSRHTDMWASRTQQKERRTPTLQQEEGGTLAQRQVAAPESELTYLRQLDTFEGTANQYTYQYMISNPQPYREFIHDEEHTIMGIIKSQSQLQARCSILQIIENGKIPDDFPVNSFRC